ncbi:hypothetical protein MHTCC0001_35080 [Flavobacteriaceae bacterium MHTCC 0001]
MGKIIFQNLLKKDINKIEIDNQKFEVTSNENFYSLSMLDDKEFYGLFYNYLFVHVNKENTIKSVTIHFNKLVDKVFYESFILDFGKPDTIQVVKKVEVVSEESFIDNSIKKNVKKGFLETREGRFEENPLFIVWNKKSYEIKVFLRHNENRSNITFMLI